MRFPVAIEAGSDRQACGVVIPDLPGCFSAGDTPDEARAGAEEAAAAWIEAAKEAGEPIPVPSSLEALQDDLRYRGCSYGVVSAGEAALGGEIV